MSTKIEERILKEVARLRSKYNQTELAQIARLTKDKPPVGELTAERFEELCLFIRKSNEGKRGRKFSEKSIDIAREVFVMDGSQAEVAERYEMSRTWVSRLVGRFRDYLKDMVAAEQGKNDTSQGT